MGICLLSGGVIWRYGIEPYRKGTGTKIGEVGKRKESRREDRSERGQGETDRLSSETTVGSQSKENSKYGLFIYLFLSARMTIAPSLKEANP